MWSCGFTGCVMIGFLRGLPRGRLGRSISYWQNRLFPILFTMGCFRGLPRLLFTGTKLSVPVPVRFRSVSFSGCKVGDLSQAILLRVDWEWLWSVICVVCSPDDWGTVWTSFWTAWFPSGVSQKRSLHLHWQSFHCFPLELCAVDHVLSFWEELFWRSRLSHFQSRMSGYLIPFPSLLIANGLVGMLIEQKKMFLLHSLWRLIVLVFLTACDFELSSLYSFSS